jgi:hypothetical protein
MFDVHKNGLFIADAAVISTLFISTVYLLQKALRLKKFILDMDERVLENERKVSTLDKTFENEIQNKSTVSLTHLEDLKRELDKTMNEQWVILQEKNISFQKEMEGRNERLIQDVKHEITQLQDVSSEIDEKNVTLLEALSNEMSHLKGLKEIMEQTKEEMSAGIKDDLRKINERSDDIIKSLKSHEKEAIHLIHTGTEDYLKRISDVAANNSARISSAVASLEERLKEILPLMIDQLKAKVKKKST